MSIRTTKPPFGRLVEECTRDRQRRRRPRAGGRARENADSLPVRRALSAIMPHTRNTNGEKQEDRRARREGERVAGLGAGAPSAIVNKPPT